MTENHENDLSPLNFDDDDDVEVGEEKQITRKTFIPNGKKDFSCFPVWPIQSG